MTQVAPVPLEKVVHFPLILVVRLRNEKTAEESMGILAALRFETREEMRAERKQPIRLSVEKVLAQLLLKETHSE